MGGTRSTHRSERVEREEMHTKFGLEKPEGKRLLGRPRHKWEDNIRTSSGNRVGSCGLTASGSRYVPMVDSYEHGNENLGSTEGREFLNYLRVYLIPRKECAPWSQLLDYIELRDIKI
jgi:hypothetical protein